MAYIKVDYKKIKNAYETIDNYIIDMRQNMVNMNDEVTILSTKWKGIDFDSFQVKWNKASDKTSVYHVMLESMQSYSLYLKDVLNSYEKAQNKARAKASKLSRSGW